MALRLVVHHQHGGVLGTRLRVCASRNDVSSGGHQSLDGYFEDVTDGGQTDHSLWTTARSVEPRSYMKDIVRSSVEP